MPTNANSLAACSLDQLKELIQQLGGKPFYATVIHDFIWKTGVADLDAMSSLSKSFRSVLSNDKPLYSLNVVEVSKSEDGTVKQVLGLPGGDEVESVLIPDAEGKGGYTACISTQVGCAMGCEFCASTKAGLKRDLLAHEIAEQVLQLRLVLPEGGRLERLVVMGIGEPLANFNNLTTALQRINNPDAFGMGARRITVSTVGLPAGIRKFAELPQQYNLAVSLHAANDELRTKIIPTNTGTGVQAILKSADDYFLTTGREYTIEYILLRDVNDSLPSARELGRLLQGRRCVVNLIPMNPVSDAPYQPPLKSQVEAFNSILKLEFHIPTHVRWRKGDDIAAACGQLRLNRLQVK